MQHYLHKPAAQYVCNLYKYKKDSEFAWVENELGVNYLQLFNRTIPWAVQQMISKHIPCLPRFKIEYLVDFTFER